MKELFALLIKCDYMDREEKGKITNLLLNAIVADTQPINDGLYIKVYNTEDAEKMDIELWYKNVDEDGNIEHGNTGYNKEQILRSLYDNYAKEKETGRTL